MTHKKKNSNQKLVCILAGCTVAAKCCINLMLYHNSHADEDEPVLIRLVDVLATDRPSSCVPPIFHDFRDPVRLGVGVTVAVRIT